MITLITGTPGAGKTAWIVQELTRLPSQRKLFVHGIPDLKIAHEPVYCRSELCEHCQSIPDEQKGKYYVENWPEWATEGSLLVLDEVQRVWRPQVGSNKLPESIAKLETHRHKGLDFWLVSQSPKLFHNNVRALVGKHIHLVANFAGRYEYEWPECSDDLSGRSTAVKRSYKLPKQIFGMYKSASLHTKLRHRKPMSFYVLLVTVPMFLLLGYRFYSHRFAGYQGTKSDAVTQETKDGQAVAGLAAAADQTGNTSASYPDFTPTIEGLPESAPAYAELIKVTSAPTLAGCIQSEKRGCQCFTNQATPYPSTELFCKEVVAGHRFNPYAKPQQSTGSTTQQTQTL
jgi:zona occludens toxin